MNDEQVKGIVVGLLLLLAAAVAIGAGCERARFKQEAAKAGHAEYYIDSQYERQWRWKDYEKQISNTNIQR